MFSTMAIVLLALLLLFPNADAQWQLCGNTGNYTAASTYQANLVELSTSLPKKASSNTTLFATGTAGAVPDVVYALALCRGDINASACKDCVATGFQDAQQQLCAFSKEATVYYDTCLVSFSDANFLSAGTAQNFTQSAADSIRLLLFTLLNDTSESAAGSASRFTTARMDISSLPTMYCAVQCTPDLTAGECAACLQGFPQVTLQYLDGRRGGRVLGVRCTMRYEI